MTIGAATVWRVRPGGDDANGAGYDATISGAGTDYSQQDAAQLSLTDIACSSNTTVTSATGGFTAAMIGNAIRITGGGATSGYYFITARTDTNTITVDRTPGAVTNGTGKVGGAAALPWTNIDNNDNAAGNKAVAGNKIYIRGAGSSFPTTADYSRASSYNAVPGNSTDGLVRLIGENGRPRISISSNGIFNYQVAYRGYFNLSVVRTATGGGELIFATSNSIVFGCVLDGGDLDAPVLAVNSSYAVYNDIFNKASAPTARTNGHCIKTNNWGSFIAFNHIYNAGGVGIQINHYGNSAIFNVIHGCKSNGIHITGDASSFAVAVVNNTIDANEGDGLAVDSGDSFMLLALNNILSNHTGSGKYGMNFAGTLATNDRLVPLVDYNTFYNNTGHRNGISAGAGDQTGVDPGYTGANDYRIGTALKALGFPTTDFLEAASGSRTYLDMGALQREEAGAGGGGPLIRGRLVG